MMHRRFSVKMSAMVIGSVLLVGSMASPAALADHKPGHKESHKMGDHVVKTSPYSVKDTLDRLEAIVQSKGATVFARVNHKAGAEKIGAALRDEELLIFGNPKLGTPIIDAAPTAGVDLPLRVVAWSQDGVTYLAYTSTDAIAKRHGLPADHAALTAIGKAVNGLTDAAIQRE